MSIVSATHGAQLSLLPHDGRTRAVHTSEEFDVYAGRPRGIPCEQIPQVPIGAPGWLGNPYRLQDHGEEALGLFESYFLSRIQLDGDFEAAVLALKGKRLGCPGCPTGSPCHAKTIALWIEEHA